MKHPTLVLALVALVALAVLTPYGSRADDATIVQLETRLEMAAQALAQAGSALEDAARDLRRTARSMDEADSTTLTRTARHLDEAGSQLRRAAQDLAP